MPVHQQVQNTINALMNKCTVVIAVVKNQTKPIYVRRGIYQGDTIRPLMFELATACILNTITSSEELMRPARGRQVAAAFMDDVKTHMPTKSTAELAKNIVKSSAREVGLSLNLQKCGIYNERMGLDEDEDMPFIPLVRQGCKYLGLTQIERDTLSNIERVRDIMTGEIAPILQS